MRAVFLHGGPGFNSFAEEALLRRPLEAIGHEIAFWNEPSHLRPAGDLFLPERAFERWLASAESLVVQGLASGPLHVIAHSFSATAALELAARHPNGVRSLVLLAPATDFFTALRNVFRVARNDLLDVQPEIATRLDRCLRSTKTLMDEAMREGIPYVLSDERLFTHYWAREEIMHASLAARQRPGGAFDLESFMAVAEDYASRRPVARSTVPAGLPVLTLFGGRDPITPMDEQRDSLQQAAPGAVIEVVSDAGHYLHLDRSDYFASRLSAWERHQP